MSGSLPFVLEWRKAIAASELPSTVRHVAHVLSLHMNGAGGSCWPGVQLLTDETSYSDRCVQRALATLYAKGWVRRTERRGKPSVYEATIPRGRTSFGGDSLSPLERVGGDTGSPPPPNVSPPGGDTSSPEVLQEEVIKEETAAVLPPPAHARDGGGEDLPNLLALLPAAPHGGPEIAELEAAFAAHPEGVGRVVHKVAALTGVRSHFGLVLSKVRKGEHLHEQRPSEGSGGETPDHAEVPPEPRPRLRLLDYCWKCWKRGDEKVVMHRNGLCESCAKDAYGDEVAVLGEAADLVAEGVLEETS